MPRGLDRTDLNSTGTSYRRGTPVSAPVIFGTPVTLPKTFGNRMPFDAGNHVSWTPRPAHFGNLISDGAEVAPSVAPSAGSYSTPQTITITCSDPTCEGIFYTLDGSTPTIHSLNYIDPFL